MLPIVRQTKSSPGSVNVMAVGTTRESQQVIKRVCGCCLEASCLKRFSKYGNSLVWNLSMPSKISCIVFALTPPALRHGEGQTQSPNLAKSIRVEQQVTDKILA